MITPIELLGKELKRGFGYKAIEVDEFLGKWPEITRRSTRRTMN